MANRSNTMRRFFQALLVMILLSGGMIPSQIGAQGNDLKIVQFSGKVVTEENDRMVGLPYVAVTVLGERRGTYTDIDGFFSIVVRTDETIAFSYLGFKDAFFKVPDTLKTDRYTIFQIMSKDTILLPEAVIYPWPDPDHFNIEFLAMDVSNNLEDLAAENLSDKVMVQLREYLPSDGPEHQALYLKHQASDYYYEGQIRTPQILNAFAWKEFIEAWKRGDFKRKKKK